MKVACFSVASMDYFSQQNAYHPGGNSLNQCILYRKLGHETAFFGALGEDDAGKTISALLNRAGVDQKGTHILPGITACNEMINDEKGERFGVEGAWQNGVYGEHRMNHDEWSYIMDFDIWSTHANGPEFSEALIRKPENCFMSVDFLHLTDYDLLKESLSKVDLAFFGGTPQMEEPLREVAKEYDKPIVLTLGSQGSVAFHRDGVYRQPALPLDNVVDTTGCGDAFQAAFTAEYLKNRDIPAALKAGAEWGRDTATRYGAIHWNQ